MSASEAIKPKLSPGKLFINGRHEDAASGKTILAKSTCDTHCFTYCSVNGNTLQFDQISSSGQLLDHFSITKK